MSHNRDTIIQSLIAAPGITQKQKDKLHEIEHRGEYTRMDKMYVGWMSFRFVGLSHA